MEGGQDTDRAPLILSPSDRDGGKLDAISKSDLLSQGSKRRAPSEGHSGQFSPRSVRADARKSAAFGLGNQSSVNDR